METKSSAKSNTNTGCESMADNAEFQVNRIIPQLIGGKIIKPVIDESKEYFGFTVKKKGKTYTVWVDSDEEGNFCGALKIEEEKP